MAASAELNALQRHKDACATALETVDRRIFELEESYCNDTPNGNLMKGFDLYSDTREKGVPETKKKGVKMDPELRFAQHESKLFGRVVF